MTVISRLAPRPIDGAEEVTEGVLAMCASGNMVCFWFAISSSAGETRVACQSRWLHQPTPDDTAEFMQFSNDVAGKAPARRGPAAAEDELMDAKQLSHMVTLQAVMAKIGAELWTLRGMHVSTEAASRAVIDYARSLVPTLRDRQMENSAKELERLLFLYDASVQETAEIVRANFDAFIELMKGDRP